MLQTSDTLIPIPSLLTFAGVVLTLLWGITAFVTQRRDSKKQKEKEEMEKDDSESIIEARKLRDETRQLLTDAKADIVKYEERLEEMSDKYNKLFNNKLELEVEITVMSYEHQLLFDKIAPEMADEIRARVAKFRSNLKDRIAHQ